MGWLVWRSETKLLDLSCLSPLWLVIWFTSFKIPSSSWPNNFIIVSTHSFQLKIFQRCVLSSMPVFQKTWGCKWILKDDQGCGIPRLQQHSEVSSSSMEDFSQRACSLTLSSIWLKQERLLFISHGKLMHNVILGKEITYCMGRSGSRCVQELSNDQTSLSKVSSGSSRLPLQSCFHYPFPRRLPLLPLFSVV